MICPLCGFKNIQGVDECERCSQDLASIDGVVAKTKIEKVLMEDSVSRMQPRQPVAVAPETSVLDTVKKMNEAKVGCALVQTQHRLEGVVTERDILFKALAVVKDLSKIPVREVMTPNPETLSENDTLAYVVNKMAVGGFRHIPITRNKQPVGIISARDVLRYLSKLFP